MCTNGPKLRNTHKQAKMGGGGRPTISGLRLLAAYPYRVVGSSWDPVPPLESPDSPYFTTELTAGMQVQSPGHS